MTASVLSKPAGASTPQPIPSLSVEGVSVAYSGGQVALRDVTLHLNAGTICGLIGLNGSGKSTLFKTIMGFLPTRQGQVLVHGQPVQAAQRGGLIAYVPQSEEVDWTFPVSVEDVVMMGRYGHMGRLRRPSRHDRDVVTHSLNRVGMIDFRGRQIGELSGGQRKRAFLARALAQEGKLLLLDEPFGGVDASTSDTIMGLLRDLRNEGHTVLISTHDLGSIGALCDSVALLAGRTVLASGPTREVFTPENLGRVFGGLPMLTPGGSVVVAGSQSNVPNGKPTNTGAN